MEIIWLVRFLLNLAMQLLYRSQRLSGSRSYEDTVRDVNCSVKAKLAETKLQDIVYISATFFYIFSTIIMLSTHVMISTIVFA